MRIYRLSLILIIALLATCNAAFAAFGPTDTVVTSRMALSADKLKPGGTFELAIIATVKGGYHIGAHDSTLYPANVTVETPAGVTLAAPVFPAGIRKAFPFAPDEKLSVYEGKFIIRLKGHVAVGAKPGPVTFTAKLDTQACKGEQCYPPQVSSVTLKTSIAQPGEAVAPANPGIFKPTAGVIAGSGDEAQGVFNRLMQASPWLRFMMLFVMGLVMAFTPCVYPMIPVTMGYFGSQAGTNSRRVYTLASAYAMGIALMYSTLGVVAALTGRAFGETMQQPAVVGGIALVLVALALSMFGLFELRPPAFIASRSSGKSGVVGAMMMGLVFGIVAAPCAGPVVLGLMLLVASLGNPVSGFLMFFVFSLGFGAPLFLLAAFSGKMPMPGMWMVTVKKVSGFLLLGAAAHFAGPVLPELIRPYMLPAVILAAGLYLGFFEKSIASVRCGPSCGKVGGFAALVVVSIMLMPHAVKPSITWQVYTPEKVAQAATAGKPVMIDFTADWCAICQELEHGPFSDAKVIKAADRFQRFRVDASKESDALMAAKAKYLVQGYPAVIFIDSSGSEIRSLRINRKVTPDEMMNRMQQVK